MGERKPKEEIKFKFRNEKEWELLVESVSKAKDFIIAARDPFACPWFSCQSRAIEQNRRSRQVHELQAAHVVVSEYHPSLQNDDTNLNDEPSSGTLSPPMRTQ